MSETNDLTPAELRIWRAFPRGESVDFGAAENENPARGNTWGAERTVRARVLRALLLKAPQEEGEIAALEITGARITGVLDLKHATVDAAIRLSHCRFDGVPDLYGAQLRQLDLSWSVLPGLTSETLRVEGVLRMTDCRTRGPVRLGGAQISGALFMERAEFTAPDDSEPVLQLNQAVIGGDLWAPEMRAHGQVRLTGASVAGRINVQEAEFHQPDGTALDAQNLNVGAHVRARRIRARGRIELRGSRISGRLDLLHAHLSHPGDTALRASSCVLGELWLRGGDRIEGALNLRRSQIEILALEPEMLPDQVYLTNLTYTVLTPHEPAERRLPMLERDGDRYEPHGYEQLMAAYRHVGDDDAARLVQLAKQRRRRTTLTWYGRLWGYVQDATVGYGFRPVRAAAWLLSLMAIGSIAYGLHHPRPVKADEAPGFNPVFYTLDLLLPVINFGQESAFAPDGWHQWLSYVLIITGWILATTIVAGVTRTVSRQ
ncbi:membrane-associated oxidoreductase [Streptomyces sp. NBC_00190]|uniref:membrane-associated oxidoreductase n=1 Tax=unclassified Streptomyces TaxID=2593676 RepID=UPI002E2C108B|nr:membrane-associated oxidoreductase [Streptomyces sp. NBC_00190]WSZ44544.1 membrane-associated oxidoreductase [Streptomyces sp. NBC_00868]